MLIIFALTNLAMEDTLKMRTEVELRGVTTKTTVEMDNSTEYKDLHIHQKVEPDDAGTEFEREVTFQVDTHENIVSVNGVKIGVELKDILVEFLNQLG